MTAWRAVGFDLDDTLYPERSYVLSGFEAVARWVQAELGMPADGTAEELTALFESGARRDTFDRWLSAHGVPVEPIRARMVEVYRGHRPRLSPYADVPAALDRLAGSFALGLATEGTRPVQQAKLEALGLNGRFSAIVLLGDEDRPRWKPDPWPLKHLAEGLGVSPREMVYVGDNPKKDFEAARRAGMAGVRMRRPDGLHAQEEPLSPDAGPDAEVHDLPGLEAWLGSTEPARP